MFTQKEEGETFLLPHATGKARLHISHHRSGKKKKSSIQWVICVHRGVTVDIHPTQGF